MSIYSYPKISDERSVNLFRRATGLDIGESEAIILSDDIHADLLLIDEVKGRQVAEQMGIKIIGTIGFLLASYEEKNISEAEIIEIVEFLRNSNRYISERYLNLLLERISGNQ